MLTTVGGVQLDSIDACRQTGMSDERSHVDADHLRRARCASKPEEHAWRQRDVRIDRSREGEARWAAHGDGDSSADAEGAHVPSEMDGTRAAVDERRGVLVVTMMHIIRRTRIDATMIMPKMRIHIDATLMVRKTGIHIDATMIMAKMRIHIDATLMVRKTGIHIDATFMVRKTGIHIDATLMVSKTGIHIDTTFMVRNIRGMSIDATLMVRKTRRLHRTTRRRVVVQAAEPALYHSGSGEHDNPRQLRRHARRHDRRRRRRRRRWR
jgi:hypothetical protein